MIPGNRNLKVSWIFFCLISIVFGSCKTEENDFSSGKSLAVPRASSSMEALTVQDEKIEVQNFVQNIYKQYQQGNAQIQLKKVLTDSLFQWIELDRKGVEGEVGILDYDPFCSCQDEDGFVLESVEVEPLQGHYLVRVRYSFGNGSASDELSLDVQKRKSSYQIRDFITQETPSLMKFLQSSLKERGLIK